MVPKPSWDQVAHGRARDQVAWVNHAEIAKRQRQRSVKPPSTSSQVRVLLSALESRAYLLRNGTQKPSGRGWVPALNPGSKSWVFVLVMELVDLRG
jgi:hypothetical protein